MTPEPGQSPLLFDLTGITLGRIRLVEKIGQGGMAQVYKGYQPDLDRYVAVKILHPHLVSDEGFAERFRREARAVAAVEHPHIVRVYDFDTDAGAAFLIMECLDGKSLKDLLQELDSRGERMPLEDALHIVACLAEALDYAHAHNLIHRDVKPSNVVIAPGDRPVLTDFGIARMIEATAITESGGTLGTPTYMSPEQGRGEPGDKRSDIYALGIMLYQLCTGHVPFEADTPYAIILKHISAPLPLPRSLNPDLPARVEQVILKALAKDPEDRFQSAGEMARALQGAILPVHAAPERKPGSAGAPVARAAWFRSRWALIAVACLAIVAVALLNSRGWLLGTAGLQPAPASPAAGQRVELAIAGSDAVTDTWIDPDLPDELWHEADLVHLQGPLTPDRLLFRFDLSRLPGGAEVVSATLTLYVGLWGDQSLPGAAVVYRVLAAWKAEETNYLHPWTAPGLAAGVDYDSVPLDLVPVPDEGALVFDVTAAVQNWVKGRGPNAGLVVMMSEDSHNMAHHWVQMSEQPDPADRPTLHVSYIARP